MRNPIQKLLTTAALVALLPATALAQVGDLNRELDDFGSRVSRLESNYLKPAMLASKYKLEARYNDARVAYFLQDYNRASILLVDVVRKDEFKQFSSYREALFLLGDSLFQMRNYVAARRYFERILSSGPGPFYEEAAGRLLEIAYDTRNFDRLDQLYATLQGGQMSGALAYLAGKAFYERGEYQRARENFGRASQTEGYGVIADYFRGVAYVAEGKLEDAKRVFENITTNSTPSSERDYEVIDLAWVALGRLAYEQGDIELAVDYYSRLARTSDHFDRALWEQTWVLVSRGNYEAARRNVDILQFFEDPDPDIVAEAKLLRADLSLKLAEYDTAATDYKAVLDEFTPVKEQMDLFATKQKDLPTFFAALVREELAGVENEYLPALVDQWIQNDPDMRAASELLSDVGGVEREILDSSRMLDEISARLNSSTRIQSFPELAEGLSLGVAAEIRLMEIRQQLLLEQYDEVSSKMSASDKSQWQAKLEDLKKLQERFEGMPNTREAVAEREQMLSSEFERLQRRLDRIGYELDAFRAQLSAVDTYMSNDYGRPLSDAEKRELVGYRTELGETVAALESLKQQIEQEVRLNRQQIGVGDAVMVMEARLREQYRNELVAAEQFLARFGSAGQIASARAKIPSLQQRLDRYFDRMNEIVDKKVLELKDDIAVERQLLNDHRDSMAQLVNASQSGAGVLAYLNFMRARAEFNEIILRGDVGLIDVAWQKKEDMTEKITSLFEDRTAELRLLQEAFEEVR